MQDRDDIFDDEDDSVELSNDMAQAAAEEEERRAAAAAAAEEDEDDDDDLLESDDDDDDTSASAQADEDDEEEDDEPSLTRVPKVARKKEGQKQTAKERIEELAEKRREAEAQAFKAEMRLIEEQKAREALEARIAALETGGGSAPRAKKPSPDDFKYGEVDPDYINAQVEYRLTEERAKFQSEQAERSKSEENERLKQHYQSRLAKVSEEGNKRFRDFDKIVNSVDFPGDVARDILDSDQGVDISYYLGKNVSKLRELTLMSPTERAKAMGRLEERFSARSSAGKKTSKAPDTPGRKATGKRKSADEAKYGPENQDDFDRAFYGR